MYPEIGIPSKQALSSNPWTSCIIATGLKKCIPIIRWGDEEAAAMRVMDMDDVLVAKIASGRQMRSRSCV